MIKINGQIKTMIDVTIDDAIDVLYKDCIAHGKDSLNLSLDKPNDIAIFKSIDILKKKYKKVVGEDEKLHISAVFDSAQFCFFVESSDVLESLDKLFRKGYYPICTNASDKKCPKKGVYYRGVSEFGNPYNYYTMLYDGIDAENTYYSLQFLKTNFLDYINTDYIARILK